MPTMVIIMIIKAKKTTTHSGWRIKT